MRNKHNEGYTLPLVMVVLLVLAIVAVTIMTTSLKNMQRQQGFIETMKAQYEAQGKIEMIVAKMENLGDTAVEIPLAELEHTSNTLTGSFTAYGSSGDSTVTIKCGIKITADDIAKWSDTINYEVVCLVSKRIPRVYIEGEKTVSARNYIDELL